MTVPLYTERGGGDFEKGAALAIPGIPMGRIGEPREIAEPVCFLLSERGELHHRPGDRARRRRDVDMRRVTVVGAGAAGLCAAFAAAKSGRQGHRARGRRPDRRHDRALGRQRLVPRQPPHPRRLPRARARLPPGALARRLRRRHPPGVRAGGGPDPSSGSSARRRWRGSRSRTADYHAEFEGGREQGGRTLEPLPIDPPPRVAALVRDAPNVTAPVTYVELATGRDRSRGARAAQGARDVHARTCAARRPARGLPRRGRRGEDRAPGAERSRTPMPSCSPRAASSATRSSRQAFLRGPMLAPVGAPSARGDGLRLAIAAGAQLGSMSEAWWCPAAQIPGDTIDGEPMFRLILTERARPGCLLVNGRGRRFVDEAQNYNDLGRDAPELRADVVLLPERAGLARLRRQVSRDLPARPALAPRSRSRTGSRAGRDAGGARRARSACPPTSSTASVARFNEGAAHGRRPRLRPRQLPLRPLHRRPRAARAGAVLRLPGAARAASARRAARGRMPTAGCSRSPTAARSRASTRRATRRRARSASPIPAPAGRSARPSCSAPEPARRRPATDDPWRASERMPCGSRSRRIVSTIRRSCHPRPMRAISSTGAMSRRSSAPG